MWLTFRNLFFQSSLSPINFTKVKAYVDLDKSAKGINKRRWMNKPRVSSGSYIEFGNVNKTPLLLGHLLVTTPEVVKYLKLGPIDDLWYGHLLVWLVEKSNEINKQRKQTNCAHTNFCANFQQLFVKDPVGLSQWGSHHRSCNFLVIWVTLNELWIVFVQKLTW